MPHGQVLGDLNLWLLIQYELKDFFGCYLSISTKMFIFLTFIILKATLALKYNYLIYYRILLKGVDILY